MAKKPEPFRFNSMTKAELIKTVKTLSARETKHLNKVARLEEQLEAGTAVAVSLQRRIIELEQAYGYCTRACEGVDANNGTACPRPDTGAPRFPWEPEPKS